MSIWRQNEDSIILVKQDFQRLLNHSNQHEPLRNQLIIDFPTQMGMRPLEITHLRWEYTDIDSGRVTIKNSKSKKLYPLPLSYEVAEKLESYARKKRGYVIKRLLGSPYSTQMRNMPISREYLWRVWRRVARRAHLMNWRKFTPRLGRHYFAAISTYHPDPQKRLGLETLRRILRHKNLAYTQVYLSRLVFFEDIQADYDRVHNLPIEKNVNEMYMSPEVIDQGRVQLREECLTCPAQSVCKYKELLAQVPVAGPCRRRPQIVKLGKIESESS